MAQVGKKSPRKSKPNYITSILMVSLVLLMVGLIGMIGLHFQSLSTLIKENVRISLYLPDRMNEVEIMQLQKRLETEPFVKSTEYISKEEAKRTFLQINNEEEDFEGLLGYNPLPATLHLYMTAQYTHPDSMEVIAKELADTYQLSAEEVQINKELVSAINANLGIIGAVLGGIALLLVIIAIILIDSTVRLAMYSNRFLIKSMQLVGADRKFITRPYTWRSIFNGMISGLLAVAVLAGIFMIAQTQIPALRQLQDLPRWLGLFGIVVALGILISWWSTHRAVTKYLKTKLDELY